MSGKSELLTLTPLISARFYLRPGFSRLLYLKDLGIAQVLLFFCLQHIGGGSEVLRLKDLDCTKNCAKGTVGRAVDPEGDPLCSRKEC